MWYFQILNLVIYIRWIYVWKWLFVHRRQGGWAATITRFVGGGQWPLLSPQPRQGLYGSQNSDATKMYGGLMTVEGTHCSLNPGYWAPQRSLLLSDMTSRAISPSRCHNLSIRNGILCFTLTLSLCSEKMLSTFERICSQRLPFTSSLTDFKLCLLFRFPSWYVICMFVFS